MLIVRQKQQIVILAAVIAVQQKFALAVESPESQPLNKSLQAGPGKTETMRIGFALSSPRKYATRYLPETRTLQIRITPARAEEFQDAQYYDGRFIHRVVVKEVDEEIFLNLQLKNRNLNWVVTHQDAPWRIIVDLWQNQDPTKGSNPDWNWNGYLSYEAKQADAIESIQKGAVAAASQPQFAGGNSVSTEKSNIDVPLAEEPEKQHAEEKSTATNLKAASADKRDAYNPKEFLQRFIITENFDEVSPPSSAPLAPSSAPLERAKKLFRTGRHAEALNEYRREATLRPQEFRAHPESLWLAGESALQVDRTEVAKDYFLTLLAADPDSTYANIAKLRLLDIEYSQLQKNLDSRNMATAALGKNQSSFQQRYFDLAQSESSSVVVKAIAALRYKYLEGSKDAQGPKKQAEQKQTEGLPAELLSNFTDCVKEATLIEPVRNECAYEMLLANLKNDDMVSAQSTLKDYESRWPKDKRVALHKDELGKRIRGFAESIKTPADLKNWLQFEKSSSPAWISFTEKVPALLKMRAMAWEADGNIDKALRHYQKSAETEPDKKLQMLLLAKSAYLAAKQKKQSILNSSLQKLQAIPERAQSGLGAEEYAYIKELALPPFNNTLALKMFLDDIFKGFHAETDIRTIVSLSEKIDGSREADILFEKLLTIPAKSSAEAELKEDALMNYAETLRNQGRLVKSADMFLAVANLDNGKNRAEAAYKAGVVFFRAGLLEKATTSWNMAASDLENSKYSALATERLNRIR